VTGIGRPFRLMRAIRAATLLACPFLLGMPSTARATMTLTGDAGSMRVTVREMPRDELVGAVAQRFGLRITGQVIAGEEPVTGSFRGDLGDVLARILMSNNFLIVYEGGKPARVMLSERGASSTPVDPSMRMLQQGGGVPLGAGQQINQEMYDQPPPVDVDPATAADPGMSPDQGMQPDPALDGVPVDQPPDQF